MVALLPGSRKGELRRHLPVICEANGRADLVIAGSGKLKGYDPATGAELWTCNTLLRTIMTSPVVQDGVIYIAVQSYGDATRTLKFALMEWLDTNQDGKLAKSEVPKEFHDRLLSLGTIPFALAERELAAG